MQNIKNVYLSKADYNVILVDWGSLAYAFYPWAAGYTKGVGYFLGNILLLTHLSNMTCNLNVLDTRQDDSFTKDVYSTCRNNIPKSISPKILH